MLNHTRWMGSPLCAFCLCVMVVGTFTALAAAKVLADGAQSHTVAVHLRVARYKWLIGNTGAALRELAEAGARVIPAGIGQQVAGAYLWASNAHARVGQSGAAQALCQQALETLAFGRYDRAQAGTSTASAHCRSRP